MMAHLKAVQMDTVLTFAAILNTEIRKSNTKCLTNFERHSVGSSRGTRESSGICCLCLTSEVCVRPDCNFVGWAS